jgi:hypothetical protein
MLLLGADPFNYNGRDRRGNVYNEIEYLTGQLDGYSSGEQRQVPMGACDGSFVSKVQLSESICPENGN